MQDIKTAKQWISKIANNSFQSAKCNTLFTHESAASKNPWNSNSCRDFGEHPVKPATLKKYSKSTQKINNLTGMICTKSCLFLMPQFTKLTAWSAQLSDLQSQDTTVRAATTSYSPATRILSYGEKTSMMMMISCAHWTVYSMMQPCLTLKVTVSEERSWRQYLWKQAEWRLRTPLKHLTSKSYFIWVVGF